LHVVLQNNVLIGNEIQYKMVVILITAGWLHNTKAKISQRDRATRYVSKLVLCFGRHGS